MIFTVHQAKTQLSKLLALVEAGEEVVIARGTIPVATLKAVDPSYSKPLRKAGVWRGKLEMIDAFFDPLPEEELRAWEGDGTSFWTRTL